MFSCHLIVYFHKFYFCFLRSQYFLLSQMISAEAPVLFAKAAEIFVAELSLRAWIHTEDNKRRTLQVCASTFFHFHAGVFENLSKNGKRR